MPSATKPSRKPTTPTPARVRTAVPRTHKLYIGGKFPRTESGHTYPLARADGQLLAHMCRASRKDAREAVVAARAAFPAWAGASAYLRGQILYRLAEMIEGRREQFVGEHESGGFTRAKAVAEVDAAIDRLVHYAGWSDKYQQLFSSVNPVSSSHFNFTLLEPTGVVAVVAPEESPLLGLLSVLIPVIVGGNAAVVIASHGRALSAVTLAEALHTSDLPGGVVNLLTGNRNELIKPLASHLDVNAIVYGGDDAGEWKEIELESAVNVKRAIRRTFDDLHSEGAQSPYLIAETQEQKTTWHPIGI